MINCPHCENEICSPSNRWDHATPWCCSYCGGMYGICQSSEKTFPVPSDLKPFEPLLSISLTERFVFYSSGLFYVYAICYSSGLPFYIGVGNGRRCLSHINESTVRTSKWTEKNEVINQSLVRGETIWFHFLALVDDRNVACQVEAHWIRRLGVRSKSGVLTNSVVPLGFVDTHPTIPPAIPGCKEEAILKSFRHPVLIVPPPVGPAPRKGRIVQCPTCRNKGQVIASMTDTVAACPHCGHFVNVGSVGLSPADDARIRFGADVLTIKS